MGNLDGIYPVVNERTGQFSLIIEKYGYIKYTSYLYDSENNIFDETTGKDP